MAIIQKGFHKPLGMLDHQVIPGEHFCHLFLSSLEVMTYFDLSGISKYPGIMDSTRPADIYDTKATLVIHHYLHEN